MIDFHSAIRDALTEVASYLVISPYSRLHRIGVLRDLNDRLVAHFGAPHRMTAGRALGRCRDSQV